MKLNLCDYSHEEVLFTGDTHFGHANVLGYTKRYQFFPTIYDMDIAFIKNWNEVVTDRSIVFHVGDVALCHPSRAVEILKALKGKKILITGNHDKASMKKSYFRDCFEKIFDFGTEIKVEDPRTVTGTQSIVLCHYALLTWNKMHHGSFMLHGHSHGSLPDSPTAKRIDVGVDCHDYKPITYTQVKALMDKKTYVAVDHHSGERD